MAKQKRNDPCSCGSGKKYKKCCYMIPPKVYKPKELTPAERSKANKALLKLSALAGYFGGRL